MEIPQMKIYKATNTLDGYLHELDYTVDKSSAELILVGATKVSLEVF